MNLNVYKNWYPMNHNQFQEYVSLFSVIECMKPSAPAHTSTGGSGKLGGFGFNTNTNSVPGQSIAYTCNAGYELTGGDLTRNCELGGGWDGLEPVCSGLLYS